MKLREAIERDEEVAQIIFPKIIKDVQRILKRSNVKRVSLKGIYLTIGKMLEKKATGQL